MHLEPRVLDEPSSDGARLLVRRLLEAAHQRLAALERRAGPEALHDFRVALRRLRSVARSFRKSRSRPVPGKQLRALGELADLTNDARDAEAQLAWLAAVRGTLPRRDLPAVRWLTARLEARRRAGYAPTVEKLARRFRRLAAELERTLARRSRRDGGGREGPSLGVALAELLRVQLAELIAALEAVSAAVDVDGIHAARIAAKRLRYLLEPLGGSERADAEPAVAVLKELQDVLGELHDAHVFADALGGALIDAASERARRLHAAVQARGAPPDRGRLRDDLTDGLLELDVRMAERISTAYGALERDRLPGRRKVLEGAVTAVVAALSRPAARPRASRSSRARPRRRARPGRRR